MVLSPFDEQTEAQFGGGGSSVLAQIREQERRAEFARIAADARRRAEAARQAKIEREAEVARQLAAFRAAQRRQQLERERRLAAEQAAKEAAEAARRAREAAERERFRAIEHQRELDRREADRRAAEARARTELEAPSRPPVSPRPAAPQPSASARLLEDTPARRAGARATRESLRSERAVTDRNDALRRAFTVVPDGPRNLAKIDELVDASERIEGLDPAEELLFEVALAEDEAAAAAGPPSILSELAGQTPGEADALIRARAGEIERGLEAHDSFLDERRRRRRNAPLRDRLRRAPGGEALLKTLERATDEAKGPQTAEQRTLEREPGTSLSRRNEARRRAFGVLEDGDRTLAAVELLAANGAGRPAPRFLSPEDEERLFEAELAIQEAASPHGAPSVLREVQEILAEQDAAEQERLIQETAAKIPGGTESVESFRAEQQQKEREELERRWFLGVPGGAEELAAREDFVAQAKLGLQEVVPEFGPQAPGLPRAERERLARIALGLEGEPVFRGALEEDEVDPFPFNPPSTPGNQVSISPYPSLPPTVLLPRLDHLLDPARSEESIGERFRGFVGDRIDQMAGLVADAAAWPFTAGGEWVRGRLETWGKAVDQAAELESLERYLDSPLFPGEIDRFASDFARQVSLAGERLEAGLATSGSLTHDLIDHGLGGTLELLVNHDTRAEVLAQSQADVDQIWRHRKEVSGAGTGGAWQTQALGLAMAASSTCNSRTVLDGGIILYENCDAGVAEEFLEHEGNPIFTMGNFIFALDSLDLTDVSDGGDVETLFEEIAHVHQYAKLGDGFLPQYLEFNTRFGYAKNPLEIEAKAAAKEMLGEYRARQRLQPAP